MKQSTRREAPEIEPASGVLKVNVPVMLDPVIDEQLREYGDGNLSAGVARAAEAAQRRHASKGVKTHADPNKKQKRVSENEPRAAGRPLFGEQRRKRTNVQMYPALRETLRKLGDNNVSRGVERVALASGAAKF